MRKQERERTVRGGIDGERRMGAHVRRRETEVRDGEKMGFHKMVKAQRNRLNYLNR